MESSNGLVLGDTFDETPSVSASKKGRKVQKHFAPENGNHLNISYDVIVSIVKNGLTHNPKTIIMLLICNKEVRKQLMDCHTIWKDLYLDWVSPMRARFVPDLQLVLTAMPWQPSSLDELLEGMEPDRVESFNQGTRKVMALTHGGMCSKCRNTMKKTTIFWYITQRLCNLCIQDYFVSDQVTTCIYLLFIVMLN